MIRPSCLTRTQRAKMRGMYPELVIPATVDVDRDAPLVDIVDAAWQSMIDESDPEAIDDDGALVMEAAQVWASLSQEG